MIPLFSGGNNFGGGAFFVEARFLYREGVVIVEEALLVEEGWIEEASFRGVRDSVGVIRDRVWSCT